jgi:hypothetical protein
MKRITVLAATTALLAFPAIGTTAAFAATPAAHVQVHAKHGADDPAGHHRRHGADDPAGHHRRHGADDKAVVAKHGADDPAGHKRHHRHHRHDG